MDITLALQIGTAFGIFIDEIMSYTLCQKSIISQMGATNHNQQTSVKNMCKITFGQTKTSNTLL